MSLPNEKRNWHDDGPVVTLPSNRSVGIVWAVFFFIIAAYPLLKGGSMRTIPTVVGAVFLVCAFLVPKALRPFNVLVTRLTLLLNKITSPLAMGLIYGLAVIPTGFLARLFGADLLKLRFDPNARSYWITRPEGERVPTNLDKQF